MRSRQQVARAAGFLGGRLLLDANRTFWTLTAWETERHMKAFRGSGAHVRAMPQLVKWSDEASFVHWVEDNAEIPQWPEAYARMVQEGRGSHVAHPSADHQARRFEKPRLSPLIGANIEAVTKPPHSVNRKDA